MTLGFYLKSYSFVILEVENWILTFDKILHLRHLQMLQIPQSPKFSNCNKVKIVNWPAQVCTFRTLCLNVLHTYNCTPSIEDLAIITSIGAWHDQPSLFLIFFFHSRPQYLWQNQDFIHDFHLFHNGSRRVCCQKYGSDHSSLDQSFQYYQIAAIHHFGVIVFEAKCPTFRWWAPKHQRVLFGVQCWTDPVTFWWPQPIRRPAWRRICL